MRAAIEKHLALERVDTAVPFNTHEIVTSPGYARLLIRYKAADGDEIPAFLWLPAGDGPFPAVLVHHQHHSQRFLGKSEVAGIAGDPLLAWGPALAQRGFIVLAPDSICFEERRRFGVGIEIHERDDIQHYIEMGERLTQGDTLMRKVLADASSGLSLLAHHPQVESTNIGVLGHSYGGNSVLFQAALDERVAYSVASGALCSYAYKREHDIPLELALIIPGFAARWDMHDLLDCIAPRPILIVSSTADIYTMDAEEVIARAQSSAHVSHFRETGEHALSKVRYQKIIDFVEAQGSK
ncbi:MAG: dienelactone hydrolase family protein [Candidatus Promineifilaceae bacterium]|nr:dienelactone hydrolase family protein [Candidatus Promineifilaceae bacterium]